jgi:hypothetical protein
LALTGASIIAVTPVAPPVPDVSVGAMRLAGVDTADSPLGDGTALVMGPSGFPIPNQSYADTADQLFLEPRGFTGDPQSTFVPNGLYPDTGVKSLLTDASFVQGQQILDSTIQRQIADGHVDAANPVVVFGWSQSSSVSSLTMSQLAEQGVPSDDVHFVLVGDPNAPNGGVLERFDVPAGTDPSFPSLGITFNGATPADLYPTDIYTLEYDGFADFPQYPSNLLSDLNAFLGLVLAHALYLGLTPDQIASAVQLPTSAADTLTDYYMIQNPGLPLLEPLQLLPVIGQPLYDLLEPDMRILVNLGYGSVDHGWSQGDADVPTPFGLFPDTNPIELATALGNGLQKGITDATNQLLNPDNYQLTSILDIPWLAALTNEAPALGFPLDDPQELIKNLLGFIGFPYSDATLSSPPTDIINALTATFSADYATLLPLVDTETALATGIPEYDASLFADQLDSGNLLGALGDPMAANTALIPFALIFGALAPIGDAGLGTLINLGELFL